MKLKEKKNNKNFTYFTLAFFLSLFSFNLTYSIKTTIEEKPFYDNEGNGINYIDFSYSFQEESPNVNVITSNNLNNNQNLKFKLILNVQIDPENYYSDNFEHNSKGRPSNQVNKYYSNESYYDYFYKGENYSIENFNNSYYSDYPLYLFNPKPFKPTGEDRSSNSIVLYNDIDESFYGTDKRSVDFFLPDYDFELISSNVYEKDSKEFLEITCKITDNYVLDDPSKLLFYKNRYLNVNDNFEDDIIYEYSLEGLDFKEGKEITITDIPLETGAEYNSFRISIESKNPFEFFSAFNQTGDEISSIDISYFLDPFKSNYIINSIQKVNPFTNYVEVDFDIDAKNFSSFSKEERTAQLIFTDGSSEEGIIDSNGKAIFYGIKQGKEYEVDKISYIKDEEGNFINFEKDIENFKFKTPTESLIIDNDSFEIIEDSITENSFQFSVNLLDKNNIFIDNNYEGIYIFFKNSKGTETPIFSKYLKKKEGSKYYFEVNGLVGDNDYEIRGLSIDSILGLNEDGGEEKFDKPILLRTKVYNSNKLATYSIVGSSILVLILIIILIIFFVRLKLKDKAIVNALENSLESFN